MQSANVADPSTDAWADLLANSLLSDLLNPNSGDASNSAVGGAWDLLHTADPALGHDLEYGGHQAAAAGGGQATSSGWSDSPTSSLALAALALTGSSPSPESIPQASAVDAATEQQITDAYGKLPIRFEANLGQAAAGVDFFSQGNGYALALSATEANLALAVGDSAQLLTMQLVGANPNAQAVGLDELPTKTNYFIGNDPSHWLTDVPNYASVAFENVYAGVDIVYHPGADGGLEYDFIVAAGVDPSGIVLSFEGASAISLDTAGNLLLETPTGTIEQSAPVLYQDIDGTRQEVSGTFVLLGEDQVGFAVGTYDPTVDLVIDPVWVYSSYLGGVNSDVATGIALGPTDTPAQGYPAYITGYTDSPAFRPNDPNSQPFQPTALIGINNPQNTHLNIFVAKLNAQGTNLDFLAFIGGTAEDKPCDIMVDSLGFAYVTGLTASADFPTVNPIQANLAGTSDAFIFKLQPQGNALNYSSFLGGNGRENGLSIALDSVFNVYITGYTSSANFRPNNPINPTVFGNAGQGANDDVFVIKIVNPVAMQSPTVDYLVYLATNNGHEWGYGITVDQLFDVYVTGYTSGNNFPLSAAPFQNILRGTRDGFLTKLTKPQAQNPQIVYSTYFGGAGSETGTGIAIDPASNTVFVVGFSASPMAAGFGNGQQMGDTVVPNVIFGAGGDVHDVFVLKFGATGDPRQNPYFLWLRSSGDDYGWDIFFTTQGNLYITGRIGGTDAQLTSRGTLQPYNGNGDAFVALLDPRVQNANSVLYFTFVGGTDTEVGYAVVADPPGNAYAVGYTGSNNFRPPRNPPVPGFQIVRGAGAGTDGFVVKIDPSLPNNRRAMLTPVNPNWVVARGQTLTFSVSGSDPDGDPISFFLADAPEGAQLTSDPSQPSYATFTWTPSAQQPLGDYYLYIQVADDGGRYDQQQIRITVTA